MSIAQIRIKTDLDYSTWLPVAVSLTIGTLFAVDSNLSLLLALACFSIVFLYKKEWLIYAIILVLFFEADVFSFQLAGARIRIAQVLEIFGISILFMAVITGGNRLIKTPIDRALTTYILINFIALINSPSMERGMKIAILILSLYMLYYVVVNFIRKSEVFDRAFELLLYVGIGEILYGLYQVFAGMCNHYLGAGFPVGHGGITHTQYIGSPWGRPYGTFVEPNWYGTICMFYAVLFMVLYYSRLKLGRRLYFCGFWVSMLGLLFSFVRASWIGFVAGLLILSLFGRKAKLSKFSPGIFIKTILVAIIIFVILLFVSPAFNHIIQSRFISSTPMGVQSPRLIQSLYALHLFLQHPILGNGPGSYSILGIWGGGDSDTAYDLHLEMDELNIEKRFDPCIITTILEDTGIIGAILFIILSITYIRYNLKWIPRIDNKYQVISLGLFGGVVSLFISYVFTTGFWIPFTWVLLGLNICALRFGLQEVKVGNSNNDEVNSN